MNKLNNLKNLILVPLLIISLAAFNLPSLLVLAKDSDGGSSDAQTEELIGQESSSEDSQIITGDIDIYIGVENDVNSNIVEINPDNGQEGEPGSPEAVADEAGGEGEQELNSDQDNSCQEESECQEQGQCDCLLNTEIVNQNEAEVENNIEIEAATGDNLIDQSEGNALIDTGDINLVVGLFNTVNTNMIGFDFSQFLFNIFESLNENIDLSDQMAGENCFSVAECLSLDIANNNQGSIENNILIDASTGGNTAQSADGDAIINTGNINVAANVFNILNSNIIGSNWVHLIINVFGSWMGDLILPGKEKIQELLNPFSCGSACGQINIENSNQGEIENQVLIQANTGDNEAQGSSTIIRTGQANAGANLVNIVNTNVYEQNWLFIGVNNFGSWQGNIFSLPPGLEIAGDFNGIQIYNPGPEDLDSSTANSNSLSIINENNGIIKNSIIVNLSTGANLADAENGSAQINTGNVNVLTNLVNILNSNIVGSNWFSVMINIFGNWQGNLAFGRPDLWLGGSAVTSSNHNPVFPGETITYTLTYINKGDADATGVTITNDFDDRYLSVIDAGGGIILDNPGKIQWQIGNLPTGESGSVSYSALVNSNIPYGTTQITNTAIISSIEDDWSSENNTEIISITAYRPLPVRSYSSLSSFSSKLEISKSHNADGPVYVGQSVDFEIVIYNNSDSSIYDVIVEDFLQNNLGEVISAYGWDLGEVFPNEEIIIDYTVEMNQGILPGIYTNIAQATGFDSLGNEISSLEASTTIEVTSKENVKEISLEEIGKMLAELSEKITKLREALERRIRETSHNDEIIPEVLNESGASEESEEMLVLGASSQRENENKEPEQVFNQEETKNNFDKLLANISGLLSLENPFWILSLAIIALIVLAFFSFVKK